MNSFWVGVIFTLSLAIGSFGQSVKGRSFEVQPVPRVFPSPVTNFNRQQQQFGVRLNKPAVSHPENYMQYGVGAIEPRPILVPHEQRHPSPIDFEQQIQQNVGLGQNGTAFYAAKDEQPQEQPNLTNQNQQNWSKYMQNYPEGRNLVHNVAHNGKQTFSVEPRPQIIPHPAPVVAPQPVGPSGGPNVIQFRNLVGNTPLMYQNIVPVPQQINDGPTPAGEHGGQAVHHHHQAPSTNITNSGTDGVVARPHVQADQIPAVQQYEIPRQIVAPVPQPNVVGRYFSGPGPFNPIQRYQIPAQQVGPIPVHYRQIPQQIVAGSPAILHRVIPGSAQPVGPVPLINVQRYEIPTQLVSTSRFIQPTGPGAQIDRLIGPPVVKAGLIDSIRFPLQGRYVKPHISTPVQYQSNNFNTQPQSNYLMSQARPIVAQTQIHTPVFLNKANPQNAHSDYRYSLTQAGGVSQQQQQPQPQQQQQQLIPPSYLNHGGQRPAIPVSVVQQHQQPHPLPPPNNQYYRIPIETIRTNRPSEPVTNFLIPPYMHHTPYPFPSIQQSPAMVAMNQQRPMYYGIGESEDQGQPQSSGRPKPVVTIEEVPRNDGKQDGESYRNSQQYHDQQQQHQQQPNQPGVVNFGVAGHPLSVNQGNDQRYGQSSHVEYDENSSENETSRQSSDLARTEPQQQQFNEGWISQEPVQQYYSDEDLRGVALNINGPQKKKKK